jgi:hypothetical protein
MPQVRRVRRLTAAAVLLAVGGLVLTGCRSDPQVAAYVGSARYSQDRVTDIADEAQAKLQDFADSQQSSSGASSQPVERPVTDQEVVAALVGRDVLKALAEEKGISPLNVDTNTMAQQVQVPPDTEYVRVLAERDSYRLGLLQGWKSAQPTEADLREVYDNLVKVGGAQIGSFDQFRSNLAEQNSELVGRSASLRKDIVAEARKLNVSVNPRYTPAEVTLINTSTEQNGGQLIPLLDAPLEARESAVKDLS